jgi:hypothetical protein
MPTRSLVTLACLLLAPPLAPFIWIALSGDERPVYLRSMWVRAGLTVLVLSALPLLFVGALGHRLGLTSDPNPNPIGLGLLFVAGALLGAILAAIGAFTTARAIRRGDA